MKYDLHCHTREGSLDGRLDVISYASLLQEKGYAGMLVTDHDSYKGYRSYEKARLEDKLPSNLRDFVVLKGIEYDTRDAGHVLIILPDGMDCPLFEKKGLKLEKLEQIVHGLGGIMGAAHPYGNGYIAITNTRLYKKNPKVLQCFDFIEVYNSTLKADKNELAFRLAREHDKPMTSGSDAHAAHRVGTAYTVFEERITGNDQLISYIRESRSTEPVGLFHPGLLKKKNPLIRQAGIAGYWMYNKTGMVFRTHARRKILKQMRNRT